MTGLFPGNRKILGIWRYVWLLFLIFGVALVVGINGYSDGSLNSTEWKLSSWSGAGGIGIALGLFILLAVSFWDVVLFLVRAAYPLRRISKSLIGEERIGVLKQARHMVWLIVLFGFLNFLFVVWGVIVFLVKKETTVFGTTVKEAIKKAFTSGFDGCERWWLVGIAVATLVLGVVSMLCKLRFAAKWSQCVSSYPIRDMAHLVSSKPGASLLFYFHSLFWLMAMSGFMFFITVSFAVSKESSWLAWMNAGSEKFKWDGQLYQGMLTGLFLLGVLLITLIVVHHVKNKKDYLFALDNKNLHIKDFKALSSSKKYITASEFFISFLVLLWGFGVISLVFCEENLKTHLIDKGESILKIVSSVCLGLLAAFALPHYFSLFSISRCLRKCNKVDLKGSKRILNLSKRNALD